MTRSQNKRLRRYNGLINSLVIDAIVALIGAVIVVSPFILLFYNLI